MKKIPLLILSIFMCISGFAQLEIKDESFKEVPGFVNINRDKMYDDNEQPYAVLKIKTVNIDGKQRRELSFGGDLRTFFETEYKDGEVWLYISYYASYIKISHDDLSSVEFYFPFDMQPRKGYELTLVNKSAPKEPVKEIFNYLIVKANQPDAMIYIDNEYVGDKEIYKSYKAGEKHNWRIECELYHSENGEATIPDKEGENVTVEKTLRPAFGYINVTSVPESGAVVFVDGKKVGQTPYLSEKMASGDHKVRVMKEMFSAVEQTFTVTDNKTIEAKMNMSANFVGVTITTDLQSDIYVDNEYKGKGGWTGRLNDGSHSLEARKASHKTSIKNVLLELGKDENIVIPDPEPICGTLDVASNPMGATIIIDGQEFGTTPRVLGNVLIGRHTLWLEKEGFKTLIQDIDIAEKQTLRIQETLEKDNVATFYGYDHNIHVFAGDKYVGLLPLDAKTSASLNLPKNYKYGDDFGAMLTKAEQGETAAQNNLGAFYFDGEGTKTDVKQANYWFKKSAENGNAIGQVNYGDNFYYGQSVPVDYNEALRWYRQSESASHNAAAQQALGFCYYNGNGVTKDYTEAAKWYRKAADQGMASAQYYLANCYSNGEGVQKSYDEAFKWYKKSADQGYAKAQQIVGNYYYNGTAVVQKDYSEAFKWYKKAADQGYSVSQNSIGTLYVDGKGVQKDYAEAVKWYRKAAEQGYAWAESNLGDRYYNGEGVNKDYYEAVKWYQKAVAQGNSSAYNMLGICYFYGYGGLKQDYAKAVELNQIAIDKGNVNACSWMGYFYENGYGVKKDLNKAREWYQKAADKGNEFAKGQLKNLK